MKITYLILDDESVLRRTLIQQIKKRLSDPNDQILEYEEADSLIADIPRMQPKPDVCILDINMPGVNNGIDALKAIKSASPQSKVFMLTSSPDDDVHEMCMASGAQEVVIKPSTRVGMKAAIASIIESARGNATNPFDTDS